MLAALVSAFLGAAFRRYGRPAEELTAREGIAITAFGWMTGTFLGMLPYLLGGYLGFLDALFESISGFTGTGATVFASLSSLPYSILFWRMMTAWIGGLGIIVIFIALLPQSGASTIYMYNAEGAGPTMDRVMPRLRDMTMALFKIYLFFTVVTTVVYMLCGVDFSIAVTHAMSTIGSCGFSTYDDSAMHFHSVAFELWTALFMFLTGGSFYLYYRVWIKGPGVIRRNTEFRTYFFIAVGAILLITLNLSIEMKVDILSALRAAVFQVPSLSTTGFVSADFETWPTFSKMLLLTLMMIGGCAGSTASGIKVARIVLLFRSARRHSTKTEPAPCRRRLTRRRPCGRRRADARGNVLLPLSPHHLYHGAPAHSGRARTVRRRRCRRHDHRQYRPRVRHRKRNGDLRAPLRFRQVRALHHDAPRAARNLYAPHSPAPIVLEKDQAMVKK